MRRVVLAAILAAGAALPVAIFAGSASAAAVYYVAPSGNDSAAGTQAAPWATIAHAQSVAQAGDTVYFRGGTYAYTKANSSCPSRTDRVDAVTLNKSGASGNPIRYWAYPGEKPVFDFSRVTDDCRIKGFDVTGSHLHLKGLEITGVRQNNNLNHESWGVWISGSGNTFEQLNIHNTMGAGLFVSGGAGNLVLNSDSHDNYDSMSSNGAGESGDGFGAHYMVAGTASNVFRGDRAWNNSDDGFDLIDAYSPVLIENSWAWKNGYIPGTTTAAGNGNGFKAGGYGGDYDAGAVKHTVRFSVAFNNRSAGFYANHHPVADDFFDNTGYNNHPDFNMLGVDSSGAAVGRGNLRNNIAYGGTLTSNMSGASSAYNTWNLGSTLNDAQFQSVSTAGWDAPRQADGSLPVLPHLHLATTSTLIDKGVNVGLPYQGAAPDLGAFESGTTTPPSSAVRYDAADYTADSWASFSSARTKAAADGLVMVRGLKTMVADYQTRVPAKYTANSWAPFAKALTTATATAADPAATAKQVATAKTALVSAAAGLAAADAGTFQTITNDTFWKDTSGNPIYSQGGGVFKFGDTYYWYGVHYLGAEHYYASPTKQYANEVTFVSIPVYSSTDLVNWKFENNVATTSTTMPDGTPLGGWVGRLGVSYNEATGKYVMVVQGPGGVCFLRGDSPTGAFTGAAVQAQITNVITPATGDQTVFTDDNGEDYLVFSNSSGRAHVYVSHLRTSDGLYAEPAVEIEHNTTAGREGNAMFKLAGKYYQAASDLHGWNASVAHVIESTAVQGAYSAEYTLPGTETDFSHVTQTGFFVTVNGTKQSTVIFAGDRWSDFAWNGIGYNQWMPIDKTGTYPQFHSLSQWQFNATTGEWLAGAANNYILNPNFQADRVVQTPVTGWTNYTESGSGSIVTNVSGGANGSRFALQVGAASAYAGGVKQQITVPAGTYTLSGYAKTSGTLTAAQLIVTDATGAAKTLNLPAASGFTKSQLTGIPLAAGAATVTVRAASSNGYLTVDDLSLVRTSTGTTPTTTQYEAETAPAVCTGTIDSNYSGYSGAGFCNGTAAIGAYAQFTVNVTAAGAKTLGVRFANGGAAARPADLIVDGVNLGSVSFESTGGWNQWVTKTLSASLNAGSNTIQLNPTTASGLANIDYLTVT